MAKKLSISFSGEIELTEEVINAIASAMNGGANSKPAPEKKAGKKASKKDEEEEEEDDDDDEITTETLLELIEDVGEDEAKKFLKAEELIKGRKSLEKQFEEMDDDGRAEVFEALNEEFPDEDGEGGDDEVTVDSVKAQCQAYQKKHDAKALKEILADYDIKSATAVKNLEEDDLEALAEDLAEALEE